MTSYKDIILIAAIADKILITITAIFGCALITGFILFDLLQQLFSLSRKIFVRAGKFLSEPFS